MDIREEKIRLWLKHPPKIQFPVPLNLPEFSKKSFRSACLYQGKSACQADSNGGGTARILLRWNAQCYFSPRDWAIDFCVH